MDAFERDFREWMASRHAKVRVIYRGRPWQWHIFKSLAGTGYRAFWFGPFKIVIRN